MDPLTIALLGLDFSNLTLEQAVARLLARPAGARFAYAVTPNADHLVRLRHNAMLRPVYAKAMLCLLDSQFIAQLARRLGLSCPPVVTGADLTAELLARHKGMAAVVGLAPRGVAALAARYPAIRFLHHQPPMGLAHNPQAFDAARDFAVRAGADFTFLALGSPVQELLAYGIAQQGESRGVGLCIGSALAFCSGDAPRAPRAMRRAGLEWLHRLACEPLRLAPRYLLHDPEILVALVAAALRQRSIKRSLF